jgi:hypothetical protein
MPLLKITTTKKITAVCSLEESTALQVDQYAAYANASPDVVVNKALEYTFSQDKDFQRFIGTNPDVPKLLRIKKVGNVPTGAKRGPKPAALVGAK